MQAESAAIWPSFSGHYPVPNRPGAVMADERGGTAVCSAADWIGAIAARQDRAAFASLFEFYAPRVKAMLMRSGAAADAAEDVAQEALLTVWRKAAYFDPARASAAAWIFTIARNLRIDRLRGEKRATLYAPLELVEPELPQTPDHALSALERDERVRAALRELSPEQVRVLQLSFFEGRAHGDIAALLNLPLGTVKSRVRLAMGRLRNLLGDLQ
jgi:RNA polymerase sigma-70 factor, ECF subfamily